jgi:lipoate-protein ligase A
MTMLRIEDEFTDPRDHLALDEALLLAAEAGESGESLRVWQFSHHVAVAGRSSRIAEEIDADYCLGRDIQILRRCSGGASVLAGPGCLMYSTVLSLRGRGDLRKIDAAHQYVMSRVLDALRGQLPEALFQGTCDLTWANRKCSGNSLRVTRDHLLYHGTLLYDFDLGLIDRCLKVAPRQPEYRQGRDHRDFVTNAPINVARFTADLCSAFHVQGHANAYFLADRITALRRERYDDERWHFRH